MFSQTAGMCEGIERVCFQFEDTLPLSGTPLDEQGHGYGQREGQRSIGDDKRSQCSKVRRQYQPSTQSSVERLANNLSSEARWMTGGHHVLGVVASRRHETLTFSLSVQALTSLHGQHVSAERADKI